MFSFRLYRAKLSIAAMSVVFTACGGGGGDLFSTPVLVPTTPYTGSSASSSTTTTTTNNSGSSSGSSGVVSSGGSSGVVSSGGGTGSTVSSGGSSGSSSGSVSVPSTPPATTTPVSSPSLVNYPFETVFGDICIGYQPTPGCTFNRDGSRVKVGQDPDFNRYGYGRDDLWQVHFRADGTAEVKDDLGNFLYTRNISSFGGWLGGTTIGVGNSGLYWENVSNKTYWFGANGVLYSASLSANNFGQAINNKNAGLAAETSFGVLNSDANKRLIKAAAQKLTKEYGLNDSKAMAVASALNSWAVAGTERGYTTDKDMDKTFKSVFGVDFYSALSAVKDLQAGDKSSMRELTDRSAAALGLKPDQAQKFIKGMYKKALSQWGINADEISW